MSDVFSKVKRSDVMSKIRSSGNKKTELRLIELFRCWCITGWRRHQALFGKPDFVFRRERVCVFVDGCFWHGCPKCYRAPSSNVAFWEAKLARNRARDRKVTRELRKLGWRVVRIWEHELRHPGRVLGRVRRALESGGREL